MANEKLTEQACSVARSASLIGDPWSLLIIREALAGNRRFSDFVEFTGAQPSVVSDRLKRLVAAGVLRSSQYQDHPPRNEYRLTPMGRALQPVLIALSNWGDEFLDNGHGAPLVYIHEGCGQPAHPQMTCTHCGDSVDAHSLRVIPGPGADPDNVARRVLRATRSAD